MIEHVELVFEVNDFAILRTEIAIPFTFTETQKQKATIILCEI